MFKAKLLVAAAACALIASGAHAAGNNANTQNPSMTPSTQTLPGNAATSTTVDQTLATDLIGTTIYASTAADAESVGDVDDIVVDRDGKIDKVVVSVGGFLGMGAKDVAIPYSELERTTDSNGEVRLSVNMTKDQLKAAPAYEAPANKTAAMRPATSPAAGNGMAGAPVVPDTGLSTASGPTGNVDANVNARVGVDAAAAPLDKDKLESVAAADIRADDLIGATIYGANDEDIGEVGDVILAPEGKVQAFIVDVGGFLGIGEKEVAVSSENLDIRRDNDKDLLVFTSFTEAQLKDQPAYDKSKFENDPGTYLMR